MKHRGIIQSISGGALALLLAGCSIADSQTAAPITVVDNGSVQPVSESVAASPAVLSENSADHSDPADLAWDSASAVAIRLAGASIEVEGEGVSVAGSIATIQRAGTYVISGTLADGQIIVDTEDEGTVQIVLNGVEISSASSAPIYVANAEKAVILLAEGSVNRLSDADSYVYASAEEDEPNAAIFSRSDLSIAGSGALSVQANSNDGIASKDGLVIAGGSITVTAVDDGLRGKDYVVVQGGVLTISAGGDGLKADNEEDPGLGYIAVEQGSIQVDAGGDGFDAASQISVSGGQINVRSGGGSSVYVDESLSAKGLKGSLGVLITGGALTLDSADDAIHSNGLIQIDGGELTLASGDDGVHADSSLTINGGTIRVSWSYEGLESGIITINDGQIEVTASDDGVNVAGGVDGSGNLVQQPGGGRGPGGGGPGGGGPEGGFEAVGDYHLYIHGGTLSVNAGGDGLDSNGTMEMTGGRVFVDGPTENMNGPIDYNGSFSISGGLLIAVGSAGMAQAPDQTSTQYSMLINLESWQAAGSLIEVLGSDGSLIASFSPAKEYQSVLLSSPDLAGGASYELHINGARVSSVTLNSISTLVGGQGWR